MSLHHNTSNVEEHFEFKIVDLLFITHSAIEFLVKGEDSTGDKYSVATVTAVTDGTTVDYATYATAFLTAGTGVLAVNVSGGNVALQVTPSSSNSTVWTTQYRLI
jgi:hypothetical protein